MELILLVLVWDKTASGTARSNTENELHSLSLLLILVWDETASGTVRSNIAELSYLVSVLLLAVPEAVSSHTKTRSRSAVQSIPSLAPRCPRGSLVPHQSEEQIRCSVHFLCCSLLFPNSVFSHTKARSRSSVQSIFTESVPWPNRSSSGNVCLCLFPFVYLSVCPIARNC